VPARWRRGGHRHGARRAWTGRSPPATAHGIERIVRLFHERAQTRADGRRIVPGPLSQQAIGDLVGASRSMVNRVLKELTDCGYIAHHAEGIELLLPLHKRWRGGEGARRASRVHAATIAGRVGFVRACARIPDTGPSAAS
jgi:hypothetical protein